MASELSRLIEDELKNKGFYKEGKNREQEQDDEETPHQALMGALRVEARVKEHQHQRKILTLKRSICIGGGLLVVIVLWAVLALKSKSATRAGAGGANVLQVSIPSPPASTLPPNPGAPPAANSLPPTSTPVASPPSPVTPEALQPPKTGSSKNDTQETPPANVDVGKVDDSSKHQSQLATQSTVPDATGSSASSPPPDESAENKSNGTSEDSDIQSAEDSSEQPTDNSIDTSDDTSLGDDSNEGSEDLPSGDGTEDGEEDYDYDYPLDESTVENYTSPYDSEVDSDIEAGSEEPNDYVDYEYNEGEEGGEDNGTRRRHT